MRQRFGNNDSLIAELLGLFLEVYGRQLTDVKDAVAARNADDVRRSAHLLKSSAGNLSARGVVQAAARLEEAAERRDVNGFDALLITLEGEVNSLVQELREMQPWSAR